MEAGGGLGGEQNAWGGSMTVPKILRPAVAAVVLLLAASCSQSPDESSLEVVDNIEARVGQFVPQHLNADLGHLSSGDRKALALLVEASDLIDSIFEEQAWATRAETDAWVAAYEGEHADAIRTYYGIMRGPWDRLAAEEPWLGRAPHPEGAGYYPEDMDETEFEAWLRDHPEDQDRFRNLHTVIRREGEALVALPYSQVYEIPLRKAAALLREAAQATTDASLSRFLSLRADALLTDDYYESDMAWMDLDGDLEVVFGPYETYEDGLFGYKAAFESFLCVVNPADSRALDLYKSELPWLERNLPIPDQHKNFDRGAESPIRVADEVYTAGDTRSGVQTIAFNLPNDERVREAKGSKKVMLKNVIQAKYDAILVPIARTVMSPTDAKKVDFQAYFDFVLHHELSHGLGPGKLVIDGRETEVRLELKDLYSALEEAKADVLGMYNIYSLIDKGVLPPEKGERLSWTVVPGLFRSARFGVTEAHGLGVLCQFNFLAEKGALSITEDGKFAPVESRWRGAIRELAHELLMLQANADYDAAKVWVENYGQVSAPMQKALDALKDVPVDIRPIYDASF